MAGVRAHRSTSIGPSCASALPIAAITEAVAEATLRLRVEAAIIPPPAVVVVEATLPPRVEAAIIPPPAVVVVEATLPPRVEAAAILPPAGAVVIAIRRPVAVAEAVATVPAVAAATVPAAATEAEDVKLTYQQGQAAGTSTQPAAAPAFLLGPSETQVE